MIDMGHWQKYEKCFRLGIIWAPPNEPLIIGQKTNSVRNMSGVKRWPPLIEQMLMEAAKAISRCKKSPSSDSFGGSSIFDNLQSEISKANDFLLHLNICFPTLLYCIRGLDAAMVEEASRAISGDRQIHFLWQFSHGLDSTKQQVARKTDRIKSRKK